jgi:outer membrane immunogenic protein
VLQKPDNSKSYRQAPVYKAPPPLPVFGWTGFYVGGNLGYSWGRARTDIAGSATIFGLPTVFPGAFPANVAFADSNATRLNGVIGGGQIGYNYQFSPRWVAGFEADVQGSGERGSNAFVDPFSTAICSQGGGAVCTIPNGMLNATALTAYEAKIRWFGTVRGRLGFLINDQVLLYGTGGLAYGGVSVSGTTTVTGSEITNNPGFGTVPLTPGTTAFSESRTKVGYAVGGGIEGKWSYWSGWTWKLEYLYVDLGSVDTVAPFPGGPSPIFTSPFTGTIATHTRFTDNIVRVGLNYKFGNYYGPVVTNNQRLKKLKRSGYCRRLGGAVGFNAFSFGPSGTLFDVSKTKLGLAFGSGVESTRRDLARLCAAHESGCGPKRRSLPCTQIGRYRREADKPGRDDPKPTLPQRSVCLPCSPFSNYDERCPVRRVSIARIGRVVDVGEHRAARALLNCQCAFVESFGLGMLASEQPASVALVTSFPGGARLF